MPCRLIRADGAAAQHNVLYVALFVDAVSEENETKTEWQSLSGGFL
jgi:hypothetical protein